MWVGEGTPSRQVPQGFPMAWGEAASERGRWRQAPLLNTVTAPPSVFGTKSLSADRPGMGARRSLFPKGINREKEQDGSHKASLGTPHPEQTTSWGGRLSTPSALSLRFPTGRMGGQSCFSLVSGIWCGRQGPSLCEDCAAGVQRPGQDTGLGLCL